MALFLLSPRSFCYSQGEITVGINNWLFPRVRRGGAHCCRKRLPRFLCQRRRPHPSGTHHRRFLCRSYARGREVPLLHLAGHGIACGFRGRKAYLNNSTRTAKIAMRVFFYFSPPIVSAKPSAKSLAARSASSSELPAAPTSTSSEPAVAC